MKKIIFLVFVTLFTLSTSVGFANKSDRNSNPEKSDVTVKTENKMSDEEIDRITERVEEIRKMDKSDLTTEEKTELKKELKEMKKDVRKASQGVYIGGTALIVIIILLILVV